MEEDDYESELCEECERVLCICRRKHGLEEANDPTTEPMQNDGSVVQPASNSCTASGDEEDEQALYQEEASAATAQSDRSVQAEKASTSAAKVDEVEQTPHSSVGQPASNLATDVSAQEDKQAVYPEETSDDAEQAEESGSVVQPAAKLAIPTPNTPLYSALIAKLADSDNPAIFTSLASLCLSGNLRNKPPAISTALPEYFCLEPYSLGMRVETLLQTTLEQRELHIARLRDRGDRRAHGKDYLIFHDNDMKEIMKTWKQQPEKWMRKKTLQKLDTYSRRQACHQKTKGSFNTMLFELFGNKALVEMCIRYPICSAAQPASILADFSIAYQEAHDSAELEKSTSAIQAKSKCQIGRANS